MLYYFFFFFNDTATTEIYTLSLHDALPIFLEDLAAHRVLDGLGGLDEASEAGIHAGRELLLAAEQALVAGRHQREDRKSTRLNSSHPSISYAVFCLKKKKKRKA